MITQKQIKEWIPNAVTLFRSIMPPISIPYPEILIASATTLSRVRTALVEKTGSPNRNIKSPYTSMMETLHGNGGTAILVYQKLCPETQGEFNHVLWHELGHFYAASTETESFFYLAGQTLDENQVRQTGYWVWNEFIAECIANYITTMLLEKEVNWKEKYKCQKYWHIPFNRLQFMIQSAYMSYPYSFNEYDLAFFFATMLTDPATVAFIEGALKNELTVWSPDKLDYVPMKPDSIEPTAITFLPAELHDPLLGIRDLLDGKLNEGAFWKVSGEFLDRLGELVTALNLKKGLALLQGRLE